jgi:hypothetical protein
MDRRYVTPPDPPLPPGGQMAPAPEEGAGAISIGHQPQMPEPTLVLLPSVGWLLRRQRFAGTGFKRSSIWMRGQLCSHIQRRIRPKYQDLADYVELFLEAKRRANKEEGGL